VCKKLIKNSQPFGKNFQKTLGGDFFDSHCSYSAAQRQPQDCNKTQRQNLQLQFTVYVARNLCPWMGGVTNRDRRHGVSKQTGRVNRTQRATHLFPWCRRYWFTFLWWNLLRSV